jgi:hypothetical protein
VDLLTPLGDTSALSLGQSIVTLLASYVLSQAIGAVYAWTFRGLSYQKSFAQALVVSGIVAAMLMLAIGNSLARGIGIVGTLALIRFRTNLRDPLDMIFVFASFGAGIATGTGNFAAGAVGTALFLVVVTGLRLTGFGAQRQHDGVVRLRIPRGQDATAKLQEALRGQCERFTLVTLREVAQGELVEVVYQLTLKHKDDEVGLVHALNQVPGAQSVSLSMQEATVEV